MANRPIRPELTRELRWLPVKNTEEVPAPPFALLRAVDVGTDGVLRVAKPDADSQAGLFVNGPWAIPAGTYGQAHRTFPAVVAYETGAREDPPAPGETWGSKAGSWKLHPDQVGFTILGGAGLGLVNVDLRELDSQTPVPPPAPGPPPPPLPASPCWSGFCVWSGDGTIWTRVETCREGCNCDPPASAASSCPADTVVYTPCYSTVPPPPPPDPPPPPPDCPSLTCKVRFDGVQYQVFQNGCGAFGCDCPIPPVPPVPCVEGQVLTVNCTGTLPPCPTQHCEWWCFAPFAGEPSWQLSHFGCNFGLDCTCDQPDHFCDRAHHGVVEITPCVSTLPPPPPPPGPCGTCTWIGFPTGTPKWQLAGNFCQGTCACVEPDWLPGTNFEHAETDCAEDAPCGTCTFTWTGSGWIVATLDDANCTDEINCACTAPEFPGTIVGEKVVTACRTGGA